MDTQLLNDPATQQLVEALLSQPQVRVRRRWARLQIELWQEAGWVEPALEAESWRLTERGRLVMLQAGDAHRLAQTPRVGAALQALQLDLPSRLHRRVLGTLLYHDPTHVWSPEDLTKLATDGTQATLDALLRIRGAVGFSLFFQQGGLLDVSAQLHMLGEMSLPATALAALHKVLWAATPPRQILTVENRAAFVSISLTTDQLALLCPPVDPEPACRFLACLTPNYAWGHLGDLHPANLVRQLALAEQLKRPLRLLLPDRLGELVHFYGVALFPEERWDLARIPRELQTVLTPLVHQQRWLPQEAMALFVRDQLSGPPA